MAWTYNGTRIYVQDLDGSTKQIIPRLQPLNAATILQVFGHESVIYRLQGKVVGATNLNNLIALIDNGTAYTLAGNDGFSESLYLSQLSWKRDQTPYQSIDQAQDCTAPVYTITMELYDE